MLLLSSKMTTYIASMLSWNESPGMKLKPLSLAYWRRLESRLPTNKSRPLRRGIHKDRKSAACLIRSRWITNKLDGIPDYVPFLTSQFFSSSQLNTALSESTEWWILLCKVLPQLITNPNFRDFWWKKTWMDQAPQIQKGQDSQWRAKVFWVLALYFSFNIQDSNSGIFCRDHYASAFVCP